MLLSCGIAAQILFFVKSGTFLLLRICQEIT